MLRETLLSALAAGLIAALVMTLVQSVYVTPLILQAEVLEDQAEGPAAPRDEAVATAARHHEAGEWKPQNGWERTLCTFAANVLVGVGYAFLLVAVYHLWREPKSTVEGAAYGVGGFIAFFVAPGLGLPPELPGTAAAELTLRQQWWVIIAAATAVGLVLLFPRTQGRLSRWAPIAGLALIVTPQCIPAPQPAVERSLAGAELQSQFRVATTICNGLFWLTLGLASSALFLKLVARAPTTARASSTH